MPAASSIKNFGGNIIFQPQAYFEPRNTTELLDILNQVRGRQLRVGGSLHSWSPTATTDDVFLSLRNLVNVLVINDDQGPLVTVGGGCQIKHLLLRLAAQHLTLPALGLISEQTIAGAISTATHGSGRHCLSNYIEAVHVAHYDADSHTAKITIVREALDLRAAKCSLGCLGVIVAVELRPRASYRIEESLAIVDNLDAVINQEANYPLQQFFYLPWLDRYLIQQRRETDASRSKLAWLYRLYWFVAVDLGLHLLLTFLVRFTGGRWPIKFFYRWLAPLVLIRQWRVVDDSAKHLIMEHELFRHIEIEIFVRRTQLPHALSLVRQLFNHFDHGRGIDQETRNKLQLFGFLKQIEQVAGTYSHHYPVCVRRVLPDDLYISMSSGGAEDFYALSFISYAKPHQRESFLKFADVMYRVLVILCQARCHWGKVCPATGDDIKVQYPELTAFVSVCQEFDPNGRFQNRWVRDHLLSNDV